MSEPTHGALRACFNDEEAAECLQDWCDAVAEGEEAPTTITLDLPGHKGVRFVIQEGGTFYRDDRTLTPAPRISRSRSVFDRFEGHHDGYAAWSRRQGY